MLHIKPKKLVQRNGTLGLPIEYYWHAQHDAPHFTGSSRRLHATAGPPDRQHGSSVASPKAQQMFRILKRHKTSRSSCETG